MTRFKVPPTGSFPGFSQGLTLFNAWTQALITQATTWNDVWTKVKDGSHQPADWSSAVVQSVDANAALVARAFAMIAGPSAPPWAAIPWKPPRGESSPVRVSQDVEKDADLRVSKFSMLGSQVESHLPIAVAHRIDIHTISLSLEETDKDVPPGEYLALVFHKKSPAPIAIVTVSVPEQKE
jgi:hypothetical protein